MACHTLFSTMERSCAGVEQFTTPEGTYFWDLDSKHSRPVVCRVFLAGCEPPALTTTHHAAI